MERKVGWKTYLQPLYLDFSRMPALSVWNLFDDYPANQNSHRIPFNPFSNSYALQLGNEDKRQQVMVLLSQCRARKAVRPVPETFEELVRHRTRNTWCQNRQQPFWQLQLPILFTVPATSLTFSGEIGETCPRFPCEIRISNVIFFTIYVN